MSVLDARKGGTEGSASGGGRHSSLSRFVQFVLVGASGLVVNQAAFWMFHERLGLFAGLAAVLSTQFSTVWNFALVERFVFKGTDRHRWRRFGWWWVMNNAWLLLRIPFMYLLHNELGVSDLYTLAAADLSWTAEYEQAGLVVRESGGPSASTAIAAGDRAVLRDVAVEEKT